MAQAMTTTAEQEVDRRTDGETTRSSVIYRPMTDIYETEDRIVLMADMPAVAPEDVDVTLERRVLTLRGQVRPHGRDGYRLIHAEYREGNFERVFTLSEDIDRERIKATHKDGVLTLELPKAASAKTKRIEVKAA